MVNRNTVLVPVRPSVAVIEYGVEDASPEAQAVANAQFAWWASPEWQRIEERWFDVIQCIRARDPVMADAAEDVLAVAISQALAFASARA